MDKNAPWNDIPWICEYYFEFVEDDVIFKSNVETLDFMMSSTASEIEANSTAMDIIERLYKFKDISPTLKLNCYEYRKNH